MARMRQQAGARKAATEALFVRIPAEHARRLNRAAFELRRPKQALVSELVERYIDPDSPASLAAFAGASAEESALGLASPRRAPRGGGGRRRVTVETLDPDTLVVGHHSFRAEPPGVATALEVLSSEQAAELLQLKPADVERLAGAGELPGRMLAAQWRFSRAALLEWLAHPSPAQAAGQGKPDR
jgi:excisionase family DNA binding protein